MDAPASRLVLDMVRRTREAASQAGGVAHADSETGETHRPGVLMQLLFAMLESGEDGGARDSEQTAQEHRLSLHRGPDHPAGDVLRDVSLAAARLEAMLGHATMPSDLAAAIAQALLELVPEVALKTSAQHFCTCGAPDSMPRFLWTSTTARPSRAACALCGLLRHVVCVPRTLSPEGGSWPLRAAVVALGDVGWKACPCACSHACSESRHFQLEGDDGNHRAVRHRMSGFHSFRAIVCDEWVLGGMGVYTMFIEKLRAPGSVAVGAITPKAQVNCDIAWAPGTRLWENAWGYCMEGSAASLGPNEHDLRATDHVLSFGGPGAVRIAPSSASELPLVSEGNTIVAELTPQSARLVLRVADARMELQLPAAAAGLPLALVVSLKYAGDAVRVWRADPCPSGRR
mmetsp:Transcript_115862/g.327844  ORF Transcript_115862/g.327844 Transcript_115862/m.327844 type:complete len:402 (+) Transcript_115862:65-1270(+)